MNLSFEEGFKYSLRVLSLKDYPRSLLLKKLRDKGFSRDSAESIVSELVLKGFIDEEKMVRRTWERIQAGEVIGRRGFLFSLKNNGFDLDSFSLAESLYSSEKENEIVLKALNNYLNKLAINKLNFDKKRQRVYSYLQRKGFSREAVNYAMRKLSMEERGD